MFSYTPTSAVPSEILKGLAAAITSEDFTTSVDEENELLSIEAEDITSTNVLVLSENLTTETVTTILTFWHCGHRRHPHPGGGHYEHCEGGRLAC